MDARFAKGGGGYVARYVGGGCGLYDMSMVDRMMLKFRPIVPKPVASGSGPCCSTAEDVGRSGRSKRRYVRVKSRCSSGTVAKKRKMASRSSSPRTDAVSGGGEEVVTLSLMPETPDRKEGSPLISSPRENFGVGPVLLSFKNNVGDESHVRIQADHMGSPDAIPPAAAELPQMVSFVTVENVAETWLDGVGCTDEERVESMENDTCPGFISDGGDRLVWTNKAYRDMTGGEVAEVVVTKERNFPLAFTCNVRVTCRSGMSSCSTLTVPCDVWKMEGGRGGCYAWSLDVKAALCLGR